MEGIRVLDIVLRAHTDFEDEVLDGYGVVVRVSIERIERVVVIALLAKVPVDTAAQEDLVRENIKTTIARQKR
jgi:hypothetical protein